MDKKWMWSRPMLRELSLFTGYGGFSLGLRLAGLPVKTIGYCEIDGYCQKIIKARIRDGVLDDAPIISDIRSSEWGVFRGLVDLITAGFPCQPHSTAGRRKAADDDRNLWPDTLRVIREVGPRYVVAENVPGITQSSDGRPPYALRVLGDLAQAGYGAEWMLLSAASVGASHKRERWWCWAYRDGLAHAHLCDGPEQTGQHQEVGRAEQYAGHGGEGLGPPAPGDTAGWARVLDRWPWLAPALCKEPECPVCGVADVPPRWMDLAHADRRKRISALGNGIHPPTAAVAVRRLMGAANV